MDIGLYRMYLAQFVKQAIQNSDGSNAQITEYLRSQRVGRFLVRHRSEKERALRDARQAFEDHRHWPVDIVISHLGIEDSELADG